MNDLEHDDRSEHHLHIEGRIDVPPRIFLIGAVALLLAAGVLKFEGLVPFLTNIR